ncbi:hypothetical protein BS329_15255 [Amycolatopsis coloradensis]|uniref:Uncharacterized protein n=2 Tax=Amycolatopsis coloradensis TaxID=76021 RepID=A0A1R0KU26_9PSEU|nr:hypothetical protein BS329_15255 [Amycolatopsis coloradensis]
MEPGEITTLRQLADALDQLRRDRGLSLKGMTDAAQELPKRNGRQPALPKTTASDLINAKSVPQQETAMTWLAACGVLGEQAQRPWLQALDRVVNSHQQRPPGAVRVRDARPRVLGVHAAIQVDQPVEDGPAEPDQEELPPYVPRDFDSDLRTKIALAGQQGGFVLVTGDSSVGKTRALFEAVKTVLPDWWLLHPGAADVLRDFAGHPAGRTVVWLDELQDYLDFHGGVPAGDVRGMIEARVVLLATCWPGERTRRVALPAAGEPDPYANDRRLLGLADVLTVPGTLSAHELRRAEDLARTDRRIRVALDTPDAGFTQVMAAGPELIRHWEHAPPYAKAVITAALDARRVGAHAPLTRDYLETAAPGYLTNRQRATPPPRWLDDAMEYAIEILHGATAALCPAAAGMGAIAGYQVADYLHQHALRARRTEHLPDTAWHALVHHHHLDDTKRIADNAVRRGRDHEAITLYKQLADNNSWHGHQRLVELLAERGDLEQLRERAANGDEYAINKLVDLLAERGDLGPLRERAANGDEHAIMRLSWLLAKRGNWEPMRERADNGDEHAMVALAELVAERGDLGPLRERAANGDEHAIVRLAWVLAERGDLGPLRERADNGNWRASIQLVDLLAERGDLEQLRERADNGDEHAIVRLARLLAERGDLEQLRERAANGDEYTISKLVGLLAERGDLEPLRERAANGDEYAIVRLAGLLAEQGDLGPLRESADNGNLGAAPTLVNLLVEKGMVEQLEREVAAGTVGAVNALRHAQQSRLLTSDD